MRSYFVIVFALIWSSASAVVIAATPKDHSTLSSEATVTARAENLTRTLVTPYLDCRIDKGSNLLWCATFQLAWDQLCGIAGGPIQLEPGLKDCDVLNKSQISTNDLDTSSFVAVAGLGPQALVRIKNELETRFGGAARSRLLPTSLAKDEWITYAYLFQHLPFKSAFTRMDYPLTFAGAKVASFGIEQYLPSLESNEVEMAKQVLVYDYRDNDDFIVELEPANRTHRIILAQIPPASNLTALVRTVQARMKKAKPTQMKEAATLKIPIIDFDILKTYSELQGQKIKAKDPKIDTTSLGIALQSIRFRLDEKGAVLESEGTMAMCAGSDLIFWNPFLVMLQKRGAETPYLALWVANDELLTRFVEPEKPELPKAHSGQSSAPDAF